MGWTFQHREKGIKDRDWFKNEFEGSNPDGTQYRVLDTSRKGATVYIAMQVKNESKNKNVIFGLVCLTQWAKDEPLNFGYKDIEDNMGPYQTDCPEKILDLLTPTDNEYALKWRKICRDKIELAKSLPKIRESMIIDFEEPMHWAHGIGDWKTFVAERYGKRSWVFRGYEGGRTATQVLKITRLKKRKYVEIPENRIVKVHSEIVITDLLSIIKHGPFPTPVFYYQGDDDLTKRFLRTAIQKYANVVHKTLIYNLDTTEGITLIEELGRVWRLSKGSYRESILHLVTESLDKLNSPIPVMNIDILEGTDNLETLGQLLNIQQLTFDCRYIVPSDDQIRVAIDIIEAYDKKSDNWEDIQTLLYEALA